MPKLINLEGYSCLMRNALHKLPPSIRETRDSSVQFRNPWLFCLCRRCFAVGVCIKDRRKSSGNTAFPFPFLNQGTAADALSVSPGLLQTRSVLPGAEPPPPVFPRTRARIQPPRTPRLRPTRSAACPPWAEQGLGLREAAPGPPGRA